MVTKIILSIIFAVFSLFVIPSSILAQNQLFSDDFETGNIFSKWTYFSGSWSNELFNGSNWARIIPLSKGDNEIQAGNNSWRDYLFSLDIYKIEGEDINLFFRIQNLRYLNLVGHNLPVSYGLHLKHNFMALQKFTENTGAELQTVTNNVSFLNSTLKHIDIKLENNNIKIFVDNSINPIINYTDINQPFLSGGIALGSIAGSTITNVRFDNIVVTELINATSTPSPSPIVTVAPTLTPTVAPTAEPTSQPTISPTVAPTASPILVSISVPSLKQYSLPWKNKLYAFSKNTIQEYGCALTSAAMILQYHGHNIMPDTLNDWLKSQPDGYIRSNLINWLAVSRYTKIHDATNSPTLEYKRLLATNENLDSELNNNRPAILKENGHFVVAKGKTDSSYLINDPGYSNRNDLTPYYNSFLAINAYRPTHSDLSYMMFVTDPSINLELTNSSGAKISAIESYIEEPIRNLLNQNKSLEKPIKILLFEKPANDKYILNVSGDRGNYQLDSYLYDTNGKVTKNQFEGNIKAKTTDRYTINFDSKKQIRGDGKSEDYKRWFHDFWKFIKNWQKT